MAYKNYHNDYDNLNNWLSHVPNYEPRETDDVRQVETKLRNQRVRMNHAYLNCIPCIDINNMYLCLLLHNGPYSLLFSAELAV